MRILALNSGNCSVLPVTMQKSTRKCMRIVYQNIYFAIGVKVLCLLLVAVGMANMWLAIFADVGVMVIAVINATRTLGIFKSRQ